MLRTAVRRALTDLARTLADRTDIHTEATVTVCAACSDISPVTPPGMHGQARPKDAETKWKLDHTEATGHLVFRALTATNSRSEMYVEGQTK